MEGSGSGLTEFLLDLTEDEELQAAFDANSHSVITSHGLGQYEEIITSGDVEQLRKAVRAEITGQAAGEPVKGVMKPPDGGEPEAIIAGVRIPGVRAPEEPIPGVMESSSSGEALRGVRGPPPTDEPIAGVMEPGPPDEGIRGVMEPGPPESA